MAKKITTIAAGARIVRLKATEVQFLHFCCQDLPYWKIAECLGKSPRTIDGYRDDLFLKLRVRSRTGIVLWCLKFSLLKREDISLTVRRKQKKPP